MTTTPLLDYRIVDLSSGIAGAFCSKILADAGADVVKVEDTDGDPLRRYSSTDSEIPADEDGAVFRYLHCSKRSVRLDPDAPGDVELLERLIDSADAVIWSRGSRLVELSSFTPEALRRRAPDASVVTLTPFGYATSWRDVTANDFTIQAWSGTLAPRGNPDRAPVVVGGGSAVEWLSGLSAALGLLLSRARTAHHGGGDLVDVSEVETAMLMMNMYSMTKAAMYPDWDWIRSTNLPDIEATLDGYVGMRTVTGQQWADLCAMLGRIDWMDDPELYRLDTRSARIHELRPVIAAWCEDKTTEEVLELSQAFRVPAAPVGTASTVPFFPHFVEREVFVQNPSGDFLQPRPAPLFTGEVDHRPFEPAPHLGQHTEQLRVEERPARPRPDSTPEDRLPLSGVRIADFTAFWAGPLVGSVLGAFGADVIHIESAKRPDGMRTYTLKSFDEDHWWEWSPLYQGVNVNKRGVTLEMNTEAGRAAALDIIASCDVVVENYSPRVFQNWGLSYELLKARSPDIIMVRMPAFGLTGPWRDATGYAQTQEQLSGLGYITGYPDEAPQVPNNPGDPIAGMHTAIAILQALDARRRTGQGCLIEVPMVNTILQMAAEQIAEYTAYGRQAERLGNRSLFVAPQGVYRTVDTDSVRGERWVAISAESDDAWQSLCKLMDRTDLAADPELTTVAGRRAAADRLDQEISDWCSGRRAQTIVDDLLAEGVPAAVVLDEPEQGSFPPSVERGLFEAVQHPVTGAGLHGVLPIRFDGGPDRLLRLRAPMLGEHNDQVLTEVGYTPAQIQALRDAGVIADAVPMHADRRAI